MLASPLLKSLFSCAAQTIRKGALPGVNCSASSLHIGCITDCGAFSDRTQAYLSPFRSVCLSAREIQSKRRPNTGHLQAVGSTTCTWGYRPFNTPGMPSSTFHVRLCSLSPVPVFLSNLIVTCMRVCIIPTLLMSLLCTSSDAFVSGQSSILASRIASNPTFLHGLYGNTNVRGGFYPFYPIYPPNTYKKGPCCTSLQAKKKQQGGAQSSPQLSPQSSPQPSPPQTPPLNPRPQATSNPPYSNDRDRFSR